MSSERPQRHALKKEGHRTSRLLMSMVHVLRIDEAQIPKVILRGELVYLCWDFRRAEKAIHRLSKYRYEPLEKL